MASRLSSSLTLVRLTFYCHRLPYKRHKDIAQTAAGYYDSLHRVIIVRFSVRLCVTYGFLEPSDAPVKRASSKLATNCDPFDGELQVAAAASNHVQRVPFCDPRTVSPPFDRAAAAAGGVDQSPQLRVQRSATSFDLSQPVLSRGDPMQAAAKHLPFD